MAAKNKNIILFLLLLVFIAIASISFHLKEKEYNFDALAKGFQQTFLERELQAIHTLDEVFISASETTDYFPDRHNTVELMNRKFYNEGLVVFFSRNDSVIFLSHNALPLQHGMLPSKSKGIQKMENGWYYMLSRPLNDITVWVASLIKQDFRYKNRFLVNTFHSDYDIPDFFTISENSAGKSFDIINQNGEYAFSLLLPADQSRSYTDDRLFSLSIIFSSLALLIFFVLMYNLFLSIVNKEQKWLALLILISGLLLVRAVLFYFKIPECFYQGTLFSASHYAKSYWLPSLGDLLLTILFIAVGLFIVFVHKSKLISGNQPRSLQRFILSLAYITLIAFAADYVIYHLQGLVINSKLSLNVNFIFTPDIYNMIGFAVIGLLFTSYYFISNTLLYFLSRMSGKKHFANILNIGVALIILIPVFYFTGRSPFFLWVLLFVASFLHVIKKKTSGSGFSFTRLVISFFVFSMITTWGLLIFNHEKEIAERQNLAMRLASEQDPIAEYLFSDFQKELFNDTILVEMVMNDPYNEENILQYLKNEYFTGFWGKYDIHLTTCAPGEVIFFTSFDEELICFEYFDFYINEFGKETLSADFIYLDNNTGRNSYITVVPIINDTDDRLAYQLFIEFEARFIPRELGFPELLVDEQIDISRNLGDYSYAVYKDDILTLKYGSYFYSINSSTYDVNGQTFVFFNVDDYSHLLFNRDENTKIIVSKPRETLLEKVAPFSYMFIVFFVFSLLIWAAVLFINNDFHFSLNFKKRLQFAIIGIVLVAVVSIGGASAWFIYNIYKNKNEAIINEKAHGILIEMETLLAEEPYIDHTYSDYLNQVLLRLYNIFFTDINIYDPQGNLLASSRPRVFEEGLVAPIINPVAYSQLKASGKSLFIHNEQIGNLEYISTYVPIRNLRGDLIAYINLPYFAQQSELRNEISYFLVAFINIYLLLLLLSVIIAFFISGYVTRPLQFIRNSLSSVTFGKSNKKIEWERDDEIGQLISEYNRMIDELAVSAELLARSERETAWREMAKQVAHEIKNPLTPMRLNVQYLQKAWKDRTDDWEERLDRFTQTMVEQIDSLAVIAAEFSDFAKMPVTQNEKINLRKFIPEVVDLYKGFDNVKINAFLPENHTELNISADRKQLLRVFNNLIKNSIQAYDKESIAEIMIHCEREENYYRLEIQDFGCGIPEELKKNIFQPYFTTKNAGMGLGLAMVKSIIESFNGHISFVSQQGEGTRFIMRIPASNDA